MLKLVLTCDNCGKVEEFEGIVPFPDSDWIMCRDWDDFHSPGSYHFCCEECCEVKIYNPKVHWLAVEYGDVIQHVQFDSDCYPIVATRIE